ncbi:MAG: TolC family protein [Candidatus Marinimicrobia bacterium]|nr:TolC family protein [Candidatus Neomarinimicrobiota bacterium]
MLYGLKHQSVLKFCTLVCFNLLFGFSGSALAGQNESPQTTFPWVDLVKGEAVQAPSRISNLDELIKIALSNNSLLKAEYAAWQMGLEAVEAIITLPDPSLSMGYFVEPVETAQGPQKLKLSLGQSIPWPSKTSARNQAGSAAAERSFEELSDAKLRLVRDLRLLWIELAHSQQSIHLNEEKLKLAKDLEAVHRNNYASGSIAHFKFSSVQIQTLTLADHLENLREQHFRTILKIESLLELDHPLPGTFFPENIAISNPLMFNTEEEAKHPRLGVLEKYLEQTGAEEQLAKAEFLPDWRIGIDYIITDKKILNGVKVQDSGKNPIIASFGISLPIWNFGNKRSALRSSQWKGRQIEEMQKQEISELKKETGIATSLMKDKERRFSLLETLLVPKAQEIVEVMEQTYVSQATDIETYTRAKQEYLDLKLQLIDALRAVETEKVKLAYLRGK